jgi:hypothetical protein
MRRLKQLENENANLKKLAANLGCTRQTLQDVVRRRLSAIAILSMHGYRSR